MSLIRRLFLVQLYHAVETISVISDLHDLHDFPAGWLNHQSANQPPKRTDLRAIER